MGALRKIGHSPFDLLNMPDPFAELERALGTALTPWKTLPSSEGGYADWSPAVDIQEDDKSIKFLVELPGMKKEDVKVELDDGVLTISGERTLSEEVKKENMRHVERYYGKFVRAFRLPEVADLDSAKATMENGVLAVTVDKKEVQKSAKAITIE